MRSFIQNIAVVLLLFLPVAGNAVRILDEAPLLDLCASAEVTITRTQAGSDTSPLRRLIHPDFERIARHVNPRVTGDQTAYQFAVDGIFGLQGDTGPVLVRRCRFAEPAIIRYRPGPDVTVRTISAAGSFNQWQEGVTPLDWNPLEACYEVELELPRGIYEYKLVLNGEWLPNPDAPDRREDLYGGYNSVLPCGDNPDRPRLVPLERKETGPVVEYRFEAVDGRELHAYLQLGQELFAARTEGGQIRFRIPAAKVREWCFLRYYDSTLTFGAPLLWFENAPGERNPMAEVLYFTLADRFRNGNPANDRPVRAPELPASADWQGGDLAGLIQSVQEGYFQRLGITMLWLSPLVPAADGSWRDGLPPHRSFSGYHGYWPTALTGVEPRFGDPAALKELIQRCHEQGLRVILDMVCHHVHKTSPIFQQHPDWFIPLELADGSRNIRRFDAHPYTTWFDEFLPTFDLARPEPRRAMLAAASALIHEYGADGLRLDAIKHVPPDFVRALRTELGPDRDLWLVGETLSDRPTIARLLGQPLLDGQFDFPLYNALVETMARGSRDMGFLLGELERSLAEYPAGSLMSNMLGNHDFCRFVTLADGKIPEGSDGKELGYRNPPGAASDPAHRRLELAFAFLFTVKGIPLVYSGDEFAMSGAGDPDCRRMFCGESGATERGRQVSAFLSRLAALRKAHPALYAGAMIPVLAGVEHLVYARAGFSERLLVVLARDLDGQLHVDVPSWFPMTHRFRDLLTDQEYTAEMGTLQLPVQPGTAFILEPLLEPAE